MKNTYHIATYLSSQVRAQVMSASYETGSFDVLVRLCFHTDDNPETETRAALNFNGELEGEQPSIETHIELQGCTHEITPVTTHKMLNYLNLTKALLELSTTFEDNGLKEKLMSMVCDADNDKLHSCVIDFLSSVIKGLVEIRSEKKEQEA
ncbi:hypothetical protein [Vibrio crassostreae]|uniref:hypothetical protein n=1 Tax=Vibrio crassostreae TaxID=246167 RepID=UPI001B304CF9|nr:hypothetical protein [Vibrio crassostreae]